MLPLAQLLLRQVQITVTETVTTMAPASRRLGTAKLGHWQPKL
jgi:hypothetical protein